MARFSRATKRAQVSPLFLWSYTRPGDRGARKACIGNDKCHFELTTHLTTGRSVASIDSSQRRNEGGSRTAASTRRRNLWALGGILFAAFLIAGDFLSGALATGSLPLPGAPAQEVVRYFTESQTAVLAVASAQVMSALSLLVFVAPVATLVRRVFVGMRAGLPVDWVRRPLPEARRHRNRPLLPAGERKLKTGGCMYRGVPLGEMSEIRKSSVPGTSIALEWIHPLNGSHTRNYRG